MIEKLGFLASCSAVLAMMQCVEGMDPVQIANLMSANGNSLVKSVKQIKDASKVNASAIAIERDHYNGMWCNVLTRNGVARANNMNVEFKACNKLTEIFYGLERDIANGLLDPWTPLLAKAEIRAISGLANCNHDGTGNLPAVNDIARTLILDANYKALPSTHAAATYQRVLREAATIDDIFEALENMNLVGPNGGNQNNLQIRNGALTGADADDIFDARLAYCVWLICFMSTGKFIVAAGLPPELGGAGNNLVKWKPKNGANEVDIKPAELQQKYNLRAEKLIMKWTRAR